MTTNELAKAYAPKDVEPEIAQRWTDANAFHADPADRGEPFCIVIPPPNVTAALHMGHALNNTLQDILIRWHRMLGDNTVWIPGTDHAGIATQTVVEKRILAETGRKRTYFTRDEFVAKIQAWKDQYEAHILGQLKAMGCSCDWERTRFTMDPICAKAVREAFFKLFKDGLIYRGKRLVNWDPATQTALADDEVEMEEIDGHFYYLRYPLVNPEPNGPQTITVATTRPETMLGDTAVAINPRDPRAAGLRGKKVRLPIVNREIPIIEDDYVVLPNPDSEDAKAKFATGFLKVTPAHDPNDYEIGKRHDLPVLNILAPDGSISNQHGWPEEDFAKGNAGNLLGLDRFEARRAVVEWFRKNNLLEEVKPYRHSVGHSYRSHVPIEPYLSDQWYVKVTDDRLAGAALVAMAPEQKSGEVLAQRSDAFRAQYGENPEWVGKLRFTPARYAKTFQTWHENIRDWCISRQLWWGHRIPVWHKRVSVPNKEGYHGKNWWFSELDSVLDNPEPEVLVRITHVGTGQDIDPRNANLTADLDPGRDVHEFDVFVCAREDQDVARLVKDEGFVQDPDVLDTWFSSALWPFSTLGWPDATPEVQTWNPGHVLCTAREIITLWVSRMVMTNLYFLGRLPFTDVFIHAMIQDGEGRKMSKSLGNGVDPIDIIDSHGSDAMRYTLAVMTTNTQDVRMPVVQDPTSKRNTSDKFDLGRNFANKLWNATRFALTHLEAPLEGADPSVPHAVPVDINHSDLGLADRWILSRLAGTVRDTDAALANFEFSAYAQGLYDFIWRDLCDWYIEAVKPTVRQNPAQRKVLALCLDASLRLLHPVMPFITEKLWSRLNDAAPHREISGVALPPSGLLIHAIWPKVSPTLIQPPVDAGFGLIQQIVGAIREVRTTYKIPPRQRLSCSAKAPATYASQLLAERTLAETLAVIEGGEIGPRVDKPVNAAVVVVGDIEIYVHNLVDPSAERTRLQKRLDELSKSVAGLKGRLENKSYIDRAPANLVQQTRDQLAAAQREAENIAQQIGSLT
ncbi:MAG: valine--tRNA ligase [Planctomycetota bacterium]|nr:valine--tRNA ligase [Planctomycetota bacterium]